MLQWLLCGLLCPFYTRHPPHRQKKKVSLDPLVRVRVYTVDHTRPLLPVRHKTRTRRLCPSIVRYTSRDADAFL